MGARQEANHRLDRADLRRGATIDALAVLEDRSADDFGFQLLGQLDPGHDGLGVQFFLSEEGLRLGARFVERIGARRLVGQLVSGGDILADQLGQLLLETAKIILRGHFPRILGCLLGKVDDCIDDLLGRVMRKHDSAQHDVFRQFLGFGFDHHHGIAGGGHDEVEVAFLRFFERGIQLIFAILVAHARSADRPHEGHARQGERSRGSDHRHDVGFAFAVKAQHLSNNVDFVVETFGE